MHITSRIIHLHLLRVQKQIITKKLSHNKTEPILPRFILILVARYTDLG